MTLENQQPVFNQTPTVIDQTIVRSEPFQQDFSIDQHTIFMGIPELFATMASESQEQVIHTIEFNIRQLYPSLNLIFRWIPFVAEEQEPVST